MSIAYEQELHDYWKNIIDGGYVNLPSKDTISYWLSHIEICHAEIERLCSELSALKEAQRWIPVSERLPEEDTHIEIVLHKTIVSHGALHLDIHGKKYWYDSFMQGRYEFDVITYWRPLPPPPESES